MFRSIAHIAGSKGMVRVPNLSGTTATQAAALLQLNGLKSEFTTTTTYDNSLSDNVVSQSISYNTLVDYDTVIVVNKYSYIPYTPTTTSPTSTGGGGTTQYAYFAFCSGANLQSTGTSIVSSGQDVTSTCLTLKSQYGNPAGWNCGSASNTIPTIDCATYVPSTATTPTTTTPTSTAVTCGIEYGNTYGSTIYVGYNTNQYTGTICASGYAQQYWYKCSDGSTDYSSSRYSCSEYVPTTTTTSCVPVSGATRLNTFDCASFFEYYNTCDNGSMGCVPLSPTTTTPSTTTTTTNTCPSSPTGLSEGVCWACGYYWNGGYCSTGSVTTSTTTTTTTVACTPVAGATRFKDSCATSLEYYDTCTGSSQGCVPQAFSFTPFGFVVPYSNFSFTPFGFTPTAFGFVVPYSNFSFTPFGFTPTGFGFVTG